ncbi:hypothetical protein [Phormidesmis priestleyi]
MSESFHIPANSALIPETRDNLLEQFDDDRSTILLSNPSTHQRGGTLVDFAVDGNTK